MSADVITLGTANGVTYTMPADLYRAAEAARRRADRLHPEPLAKRRARLRQHQAPERRDPR